MPHTAFFIRPLTMCIVTIANLHCMHVIRITPPLITTLLSDDHQQAQRLAPMVRSTVRGG